MNLDAAVDDLAEHLLVNKHVDLGGEEVGGVGSVNEAEILRDRRIEDDLAEGGGDESSYALAVHFLGHADPDINVQADIALVICHHCFVDIIKCFIY